MKKTILLSLCLLFMTGTFAFGYAVTGRVLDASGNGVSGASVYIDCYPSSGSAHHDTDTSGTYGGYAGGWALCNCNGEKMVVKAVKGNQSGTVTWTASGVADVKNVTISQPMPATAELHCEAEPMAIEEPYSTQVAQVQFYMQPYATPLLVNGGHTTMHYNTETMSCTGVSPMAPFTFSEPPIIDPVTGTIDVQANAPPGMYIPVPNGVSPTPFFSIEFEAQDFNLPGTVSYVTLTSSEIETEGGGMISAFPSQTECVLGEPEGCKPYFMIDSQSEWAEALASEWLDASISPMLESEWDNYIAQWNDPESETESEPYPDTTFMPAELWVYGGGGGGAAEPCDAGLVMAWGPDDPPTGEYASAWKYDYGMDPDLRNSTIKVTITAPQFGIAGVQINAVSFAITDVAGLRRSWWWNVGNPPAPIQWNTPTTVTINTAKTGLMATTPIASGYMNAAGFNLAQSQSFDVDENGAWIFGSQPIPPPGKPTFGGMWNYWHNLLVTRNIGGPPGVISKWYIKYTQPPVVIDPNEEPPQISGWDELSDYEQRPVMADDFPCYDDRPITDIHWWGSFLGWSQPYPPQLPSAFHIGIWTDVPDPDPCDIDTFSHPKELIWENYCDNYVWNFVGYDVDPRNADPTFDNEACFQFTQLLSEDEWFQQEPLEDSNQPNIYWLSIAPIWAGQTTDYQWGWKTRKHIFQDDAVRIQDATTWPVALGSHWTGGVPLQYPEWPGGGETWDLAFELTTNMPDPNKPASADLNGDRFVDFFDFAIFANQWLTTVP